MRSIRLFAKKACAALKKEGHAHDVTHGTNAEQQVLSSKARDSLQVSEGQCCTGADITFSLAAVSGWRRQRCRRDLLCSRKAVNISALLTWQPGDANEGGASGRNLLRGRGADDAATLELAAVEQQQAPVAARRCLRSREAS